MWHGLVNTQYFKEAAIDFKRNGGRYTLAPRGSREYTEYWKIQEERCRLGYKVGDIWIPGRYYFYLNFFPMWKVPDDIALAAYEDSRDKNGRISKRTADKIQDFPRFNEMQYEWFMFKHIAWHGGTFMGITSPGGKHICCGKTRGAGFSYMEAADGIYNYNFIPGSKSYYFAAQENYLTKDGILVKVQEGLDWINQYSPRWLQNRHEKQTLMHQKASYIDELGNKRGSKSEIMGVIVNDPNKAHPYSAKIHTPNGVKLWQDIHVGDTVFGSNGKPVEVIGEYEQGEQDIYTVTFNDGRTVQTTDDHFWVGHRWDNKQENLKVNRRLVKKIFTTKQIQKFITQSSYKYNKVKIQLNEVVSYEEQEVPIEAYTLGLLLGDGTLKKATNNQVPLTMKWDDVDAIRQFIPYQVIKETWGGDIRNNIKLPNCRALLTSLNLHDKVSGTKFIPDCYKFNSKEVRLAILCGLLDTDGSVTKDYGIIEYCTKSKQLAKDFMWVVRSLGFGGTIKSKFIKGAEYYRCYIYCKPNELKLFKLPRKVELIKNKKYTGAGLNKSTYVQIESVEFSHREPAKCIMVDAKDHLYLIEDFIVTKNTRGKRGKKITFEEAGSFKNLKAALEISMGSLRDGDFYVGQCSVFGTGGEEGESLEGLEDIFYNPHVWDMLAFPNIWEDGGQTECGYFVPSFRANFVYSDKDGNTDMSAAMRADEIERDKKRESKDPKNLDRRKAEYPQKPSEMFNRLDNNGFDIAAIDAQIKRVQNDNKIQSLLRFGKFIRSSSEDALNGVIFVPGTRHECRPIEEYPHKHADDLTGCITIIERPFIDQSGKVPVGMYQLVFDAYYKDDAEDRTSLFDFRVFKIDNNISPTFTRLPVAWGTMRPARLATCHEQLFMMCDYYNCSAQGEISGGGQGVLDYAKQKRLLHRVEYEPEMLHNKEIATRQKNKSYLMNMSSDRKKMGMTYLEQWHVEPIGVNEDGEIIRIIDKIYDIGFLRELRKGGINNSDRMSSSLIAMFMLKENVAKIIENKKENNSFFDRVLFAESGSRGGSEEFISSY